jgi:hypothetical protein
MNDQDARYPRLRYTAIGALAALAVVGAIAGTAALAAKPDAKPPARAADPNCEATKTPAPAAQGKAAAPQPDSSQLFLNDVQRLVDDGTITAAEGRVVDGEIQAGRVDTQTLADSGFTPAQLQAVQDALSGTKQSLAATVHGTSK